jgi:hypothetical protein
MPRTNLVFGDIEGKRDALRVECTKRLITKTAAMAT